VGIIADIINHANFFVNRFRGFGVLTPPPKKKNVAISIGLTGRSYTTVPCYTVIGLSISTFCCVKLEFHGTDTDTDTDTDIRDAYRVQHTFTCIYTRASLTDILARILARKIARVGQVGEDLRACCGSWRTQLFLCMV